MRPLLRIFAGDRPRSPIDNRPLAVESGQNHRHGHRRVLEIAAFYGVLLTTLIVAVPNGTVNDRGRSTFVFAICIFAFIRFVENVWKGGFKLADPLLLTPAIGVVILAVLQLFPEYLGSGFATEDPNETKRFIATFTALILAGEILLRYTTTRRRLLALIYVVLIVGVGSGLFGLLRQILPNGENFLTEYVIGPNAAYAQFVNRNHFGFLMEMTTGVLLGLVLRAGISQSLKLLCWVTIGIIGVSTILANSRGAILSMVGLGVFAIIFHFLVGREYENGNQSTKQRVPAIERVKAVLLPVAACCIFAVVSVLLIAFVGGDAVASRIETIQGEIKTTEDGKVERSKIWQSTIELIKQHPVAGVGFGAYAVGITRFDTFPGDSSLEQAHNDYLEILANGGIIAFLLMLFFFAVLFARIRGKLNSPASRLRNASCFGAATGIVGVMLHSFVDFGLHVTINALIFIILVVISTARLSGFEEA